MGLLLFLFRPRYDRPMAEWAEFVPPREPVIQAFLVEDVEASEPTYLRYFFDFIQTYDTRQSN